MTDPVIAQKSPMPVDVEAGKTYFWCACGKSAKQPFCDGSHGGTDFTPMQRTADETKRVFSTLANTPAASLYVTAAIASFEI